MKLEINKNLILKRNDSLLEEFLTTHEEGVWIKNYYRKAVEQICRIKDGYLIVDKPRIKTSFCFGSGWDGVSSLEEDEIANDLANQARTDEAYFLEENLKDLNKKVEMLKNSLKLDYDSYDRVVFIKNGLNQYAVVTRKSAEYWNEEYEEASDKEVREILSLYLSVRENFKRRLSAYLKKYGLSKIDSWTYLRD